MGNSNLTLKAFWEEVEQRLVASSADELREILRVMAREVQPAGRQAFLDRLRPPAPATPTVKPARRKQDGLLAEIGAWLKQLKAAAKQAGEWDEDDDWGYGGRYGSGGYDDEDRLGPYADLVPALEELFERAGAAFDTGQVALARDAYARLFGEALTFEDEYGRGIDAYELNETDIGEARARYLRACYESWPPEERPAKLLELLRAHSGPPSPWLRHHHVDLRALIEISPRPLPDQERFLADWIALLRAESGGDADVWLREAIGLAYGTQGLADLAREEGLARPLAYVDWLAALEREGRDRELLTEAQAALGRLPAGLLVRAAIADLLCGAALRLEELDALRAGRWEAFWAQPALTRLLDLWEIMSPGPDQVTAMRRAARYLRDQRGSTSGGAHVTAGDLDDLDDLETFDDLDELSPPALSGGRFIHVQPPVLAHALLLSGEWEEARALAGAEQALGWSNSTSSQGLVVTVFLTLLSGQPPGALPNSLAALWRTHVRGSDFPSSTQPEAAGELAARLEYIYTAQLQLLEASTAQREELLAWCLEVMRRRVEAIVRGQKRGAYDRAALLIGACAETLRALGDETAAAALLAEIRAAYPRHSSFRAELDKLAVQPRPPTPFRRR